VLGDASGAGYVNKAGDILQRVLLLAGIDSSLIDAAAFTQLNIDQAAEQGIATLDRSKTIAEVAEQLLEGVGAFGGFSRLNLFTAAVLKAPIAPAARRATPSRTSSIRACRCRPQSSPRCGARASPGRRTTRCMTDLAASVTAARRTFASQPSASSRRDLTSP
jgi:hypothetical protein